MGDQQFACNSEMQRQHAERITQTEGAVKSLGRSVDGLREALGSAIGKIDSFMDNLLEIHSKIGGIAKDVAGMQNGTTIKIVDEIDKRLSARDAAEDRKRSKSRWIYGAVIALITLGVNIGWKLVEGST